MSHKNKVWSDATNAARSEDLAWIAAHGGDQHEAAMRLGLTVDTLDRWCERNNKAAWVALVANHNRLGHVRQGSAGAA